jgi:hypothetical protein
LRRHRWRQFHREVVDFPRGCKRGHSRGGNADLTRIELRRILPEDFLDIPHHRVCIERRTVVEFDAGPQLENPFGFVGIVDVPLGRELGNHDARLVRRRQVPHRQRVIHGQPGKAIALKTLIGLAQGARNIGSSHADA